jgi:beta-glucosidase
MIQFPPDFLWGVCSSAHQIEGGWNADGKGPSIWDAFALIPGRIEKNATAQVSADHYHRMREDVDLMASLGVKAYRFSISWPRILPQGTGMVNKGGIRFYSNLIDSLLEKKITPWPTLFHWDLPLTLQFEKDGMLNPEIAGYFREYADVCFGHFGDRVKYWLTFNEPWVYAMFGHGFGTMAPGRKSRSEPYLAGHHFLLAHAAIVDCYREKYQTVQKGRIGIPLNCDWREPLTDKKEDIEAAQRALEFYLGWFADPIFLGDYPESMKKNVGERLPAITADQRRMIEGSADFFALNHYTTHYAAYAETNTGEDNLNNNSGFFEDQHVELTSDPGWEKTTMDWNVVPWGLRKLLHWIDERYGHPELYVSENGTSFEDRLVDGKVDDPRRKAYYDEYIKECHNAVMDGVDLRGYFIWSLLDDFEWNLGYSKKFGLCHVDFKTGERIPKSSALWYKDVIEKNGM